MQRTTRLYHELTTDDSRLTTHYLRLTTCASLLAPQDSLLLTP